MLEKYQKQVALLLSTLPHIAKEGCFALKGGTAINLFYQNLPRLSVDIDLTYINFDDRATSAINITNALNNIISSLHKAGFSAKLQGNTEQKIICSNNHAMIKIEPNYVIRGCFESPVLMPANTNVEAQFFPVDMLVVSKAEVYGGKICAALDRQHPRDLFDIKYLIEHDGEISSHILWGFITFLLSSNTPNILDNRHVLETEFNGMSDIEFTYEQHLQTLHQLIDVVQSVSKKTYKTLLLDFISLKADLSAYHLERLPAIQWKIHNLHKLRKNNLAKFEEQYAKLCELLE